MVFEEMLRDERAEGRAEGRVDAILELLRDKGEVSEALEERIRGQKDSGILKSLLLRASRAASVEEFENGLDS